MSVTAKNPYMPRRDHRFEYSTEACEFIERTNCAKGCIHAEQEAGYINCGLGILVTVAIGDPVAIPELHDGGRYIKCLRRTPPVKAEEEPVDQGPDLFEAMSE